MAADFQMGEIPPGFAFTESGGRIHYKYGIVLATPAANQAGWSGEMWISFGAAWADAKIKVNWHDGTNWSTAVDLDVKHADPGSTPVRSSRRTRRRSPSAASRRAPPTPRTTSRSAGCSKSPRRDPGTPPVTPDARSGPAGRAGHRAVHLTSGPSKSSSPASPATSYNARQVTRAIPAPPAMT